MSAKYTVMNVEMDPSDFLQYPQYFSLFMIWASGYIFVYSIFRKSRAWKELDSTIKVVVALITGFGIEFCLVLPLFYLNMENLNTPLLLPAFDKTWTYNWLITALVAVLFLKVRNREGLLKALHITFAKLLYYMFLGWSLIATIFLVEYSSLYSAYIRASSSVFSFYLGVNLIFAVFGCLFCLFFQLFTESAYEEEKIYGGRGYTFVARKHYSKMNRRLFLFCLNARNMISRFLESNWRFVPILIVIMSIAVIIPLDLVFTFFTPKVNSHFDVTDPHRLVYVSLTAQFRDYNETPIVYINFSRTTLDMYEIVSSKYDRLGSLTIPLEPQYMGQYVMVGHYRQYYNEPKGLLVISDYSLGNNVTLTPLPTPSDAKTLQINYEKMKGQSFNITLIYWKNIANSSVFVTPSQLRGVYLNATYDVWIQEFKIVNSSEESIYLYEMRYDRLSFSEANRDSVQAFWNGTKIEPITTFENSLRFSPFEIKPNQTAAFTIQFLSTNKFPE